MIRNNFNIAWRSLVKNKSYSFINIFGLAIGLTCSFIISLYILDELSYDNFHTKKDSIYRIVHSWKDETGSYGPDQVWGNYPVGPALQAEFPEIEKMVQFSGQASILLRYGKKTFQEDRVFFMDSAAFDVFTWDLVKGNPQTALIEPYSVVLTESTAKKYFGDTDPMGKVLEGGETGGRAGTGVYKVTGIMKDVPSNSHLKFDALMSLSSFRKTWTEPFESWGYVDFYTYFILAKENTIQQLNAKIPAFLDRNKDLTNDSYSLRFESMNDAYLQSKAERQPGETGNPQSLYIFAIIGVFILCIACANFMNLATSRSMERAKEVGVRKALGADKKSLILQFMQESILLVIIAAIIGIALTAIFLPLIENFAGKTFALSAIINWKNTLIFFVIIATTALTASIYPSFILSNFNPISVLKGTFKVAPNGVTLRRIMVVFQFTLSIALIAGTFIVFEQLKHLQNKNLGFIKDAMLVIDYNYDGSLTNKTETMKQLFLENKDVISASVARTVPGTYFPHAGTRIETSAGKLMQITQPLYQVDVDYLNNFGIEVIAGRGFSRDFAIDSNQSLVVNEAAAKAWGYQNPKDIIGKRFDQWGRQGQVIGVVKDFNYRSLHQIVEPLTLILDPTNSRYLTLKIKTDRLSETLNSLEKKWAQIAPNRPFSFTFLDNNFNKQYEADYRFQKLFTAFSGLGLFIACLGLLGLAAYSAQQRTKEIGVRKVLGASIFNIVNLLTLDFVKLVFIAIIIATPIAWLSMDKWLSDFAYRIHIQFWTFLLAGIMALILAIVTVSWQAIRTARTNPVNSLREE